MARFDTGENFTAAAGKDCFLLVLVESLELSSSEAGLGDVGVLGDDLKLLGDGNGCLLDITSDHNDINTRGFTVLNGLFDFGADGVLDANVSQERETTFEVVVLGGIRELGLSVVLGDVVHAAAFETDGDAEDAEALGGNLEDFLVKSSLN